MTQCDFDFRPVGPGRGRPCQENGGLGEFLRLSGAPPPAPCGGGPPRPERDQSRMKSKESQAPTRVSDSGESCNVTCSKCERGSDATRSCRGVCEGCRNDVRIVIRNPNHCSKESWSSARAASCCLAQPLSDSWTSAPACSYLSNLHGFSQRYKPRFRTYPPCPDMGMT